MFDSITDVDEEALNTILEESEDEFLAHNLTLLDSGSVIIITPSMYSQDAVRQIFL